MISFHVCFCYDQVFHISVSLFSQYPSCRNKSTHTRDPQNSWLRMHDLLPRRSPRKVDMKQSMTSRKALNLVDDREVGPQRLTSTTMARLETSARRILLALYHGSVCSYQTLPAVIVLLALKLHGELLFCRAIAALDLLLLLILILQVHRYVRKPWKNLMAVSWDWLTVCYDVKSSFL